MDECLIVSRCGLVSERVSGCDWLIERVSIRLTDLVIQDCVSESVTVSHSVS